MSLHRSSSSSEKSPPNRFSASLFWGIWIGSLVLLMLTNRWPSETATHGDSIRYSEMAAFAPSLPDASAMKNYNSSYTQRITVPYVVGLVRWLTGLDLTLVFRLGVIMVVFGITFIYRAGSKISRVPIYGSFSLLIALSLLMNPYYFRHYLLWPELLHELVFVLGTTLVCVGVGGKKPIYWISGFILAAVGRQTAVVLLPAFALVLFLEDMSWRDRISRISMATAACLGTIWILVEVSKGFTTSTIYRSIFKNSVTGLWYWILDFIQGSRAHYTLFTQGAAYDAQNFDFYTTGLAFPSEKPRLSELVEFLARNLIPLIVAISANLVLIIKRRRHESWRDIFSPFRIFLVAVAFMICLQPLLLGPYGGGSHNAKYCSYAITPLSLLWLSLSKGFEMKRTVLIACITLLFISSFHHVYSMWNGNQSDAKKFAILYFGTALMNCAIFILGWRFTSEGFSETTQR